MEPRGAFTTIPTAYLAKPSAALSMIGKVPVGSVFAEPGWHAGGVIWSGRATRGRKVWSLKKSGPFSAMASAGFGLARTVVWRDSALAHRQAPLQDQRCTSERDWSLR